MKEIDTEIRHVTKPGSNIFRELGFEKAEAEVLNVELGAQVAARFALREQLMSELGDWIKANHFTQEKAAAVLKVSRPRVSDIVNKKVAKFTIDGLVDLLERAGKHVRIAVG